MTRRPAEPAGTLRVARATTGRSFDDRAGRSARCDRRDPGPGGARRDDAAGPDVRRFAAPANCGSRKAIASASLAAGFRAMGSEVEEYEDGFRLTARPLHGATARLAPTTTGWRWPSRLRPPAPIGSGHDQRRRRRRPSRTLSSSKISWAMTGEPAREPVTAWTRFTWSGSWPRGRAPSPGHSPSGSAGAPRTSTS